MTGWMVMSLLIIRLVHSVLWLLWQLCIHSPVTEAKSVAAQLTATKWIQYLIAQLIILQAWSHGMEEQLFKKKQWSRKKKPEKVRWSSSWQSSAKIKTRFKNTTKNAAIKSQSPAMDNSQRAELFITERCSRTNPLFSSCFLFSAHSFFLNTL